MPQHHDPHRASSPAVPVRSSVIPAVMQLGDVLPGRTHPFIMVWRQCEVQVSKAAASRQLRPCRANAAPRPAPPAAPFHRTAVRDEAATKPLLSLFSSGTEGVVPGWKPPQTTSHRALLLSVGAGSRVTHQTSCFGSG